jgi:serine/threonine-protein kinase
MLALGVAAPATAEKLPQFVTGAVWNQEITSAPLHPNSSSMISTLAGLGDGGFGNGRMQIDFSLHVVHADPGAPVRTIQDAGGYFLPDCEPLGTAMPVPADATIEGQVGPGDLTCNNASDDCHLLVVQGTTLYEAYSVTSTGPTTTLEARCLAIWYLDSIYPPEGRGEHCTSADAAGFPMAPLLFNADEVAASLASDPSGGGDLGHAIRFILPNDHMASDSTLGGVSGRLYVRPATHAGGPSGPTGSVPYGARLRLKSTFDDSGYSPAAKVILNTFERYGMVLADGGSIALTAESDLYTTTKWEEDLGIGPHVFWDTENADPVEITDFEVIDTGPRIAETYDCVRTDVQPGGGIFADGFETGDASRWSQAVGE